jgi:serine/threonine protein kinase
MERLDFLGAYAVGGVVFETRCSIVFESYHPLECAKIALKCRKKSSISPASIEDECFILREQTSECVLRPREIFDVLGYRVLVFPLALGGDVYDRLVARGPMLEDAASRVIYAGLCALTALHGQGVVHRNVKPENFLLMDESESDPDVLLTGFGLARRFVPGETFRERVGSLTYRAPEMVRGDEYTEAVDVWALGVTMYVIVSGETPWPADGAEEAIVAGQYDFDSEPWDRVSPEARDLIEAMMTTDPDNRIAPDEAKNHQWFEQFFPRHGKPRAERDVIAATQAFSPMDRADGWDETGELV